MKRLFITIAMAALMLVAGTNVWIANRTNNMENNLTLENVEAHGSGIGEGVLWFFIGYFGSKAIDAAFFPTDGRLDTEIKQLTISGWYKFYKERWICPPCTGANACIPGSYGPWEDKMEYIGPQY